MGEDGTWASCLHLELVRVLVFDFMFQGVLEVGRELHVLGTHRGPGFLCAFPNAHISHVRQLKSTKFTVASGPASSHQGD